MFAFKSLSLVLTVTFVTSAISTVKVEGKTIPQYQEYDPHDLKTRVVRDVDGLPAEEDAHTLETIRHDLTRIRNAENRLNKLIDSIQSGFESGKGIVNSTFTQFIDRIGRGTSDIRNTFESFRENAPKTFPALVDRISSDSHVLLETLHRRLDALGNTIKVFLHDNHDHEEASNGDSKKSTSTTTSTEKPKEE